MSATGDDMNGRFDDERVLAEVAVAHGELAHADAASLARAEALLRQRMESVTGEIAGGRPSGGVRRFLRIAVRVAVAGLAVATGIAIAMLRPPGPTVTEPGFARAEMAKRAASVVEPVPGPGEVLYQEAFVEGTDVAGNKGTEVVREWRTWDGTRRRVERVSKRVVRSTSAIKPALEYLIKAADETSTVIQDRTHGQTGIRTTIRGGEVSVTKDAEWVGVFHHPHLNGECQDCHSTHYSTPSRVSRQDLSREAMTPTATADVRRAYTLMLLNEGTVRLLGRRTVDGRPAYLFRYGEGPKKGKGTTWQDAYLSTDTFRVIRQDTCVQAKSGLRNETIVRFRDRRVMSEKSLKERFFVPRLPEGPLSLDIVDVATGGGWNGTGTVVPDRVPAPPASAYWFGLEAVELGGADMRVIMNSWRYKGRFALKPDVNRYLDEVPRMTSLEQASRFYDPLSAGRVSAVYATANPSRGIVITTVATVPDRPAVLDDPEWTFGVIMGAARPTWFGYPSKSPHWSGPGQDRRTRTLIVRMPDAWVQVTGVSRGTDMRKLSDSLLRAEGSLKR